VSHASARLNLFGRELLIERVLEGGWTAAVAAEAAGVSRATVYKWLGRFRSEGLAGLGDRSSCPSHSPRRLSASVERRIVRLRQQRKLGPHRLGALLGVPRSTCYAVLRRHGVQRLDWMDRPTGEVIRRYERARPGELIHVDVKKLGRIPPGGGWRVLGLGVAPQDRRVRGYDHLEVFVDDASRYAVVVPVADERAESASRALELAVSRFAEVGIRIERMLTDNGATYRSHIYRDTLARFEIRHKRTRPYRPQTNGKAERFIQTLINEWAYARPYRSNDDRMHALRRFVDFYNHGRPHTAIGGLVPRMAVNNVPEHHI